MGGRTRPVGRGGGINARRAFLASSAALLVCLAFASLRRAADVSFPGPHSLRKERANETNVALPGSFLQRKEPKGGAVPPRRRAWVVLVENRDLATSRPYGYYTLAMWQLYTSIVPDCEVLVYNSSALCKTGGHNGAGGYSCAGYGNVRLSAYWMKVLAVLNAMEEADEGDLVVFMDTDMQVLNANFTRSILDLEEVREFLSSNRTMLVIEEHTDSYWGNRIKETGLYRAPVVSNMFAAKNDETGRRMMRTWWQSAGRVTKWDRSGGEFLWEWPWEQERLAAYYDAAPELFFSVNQSWAYMGWMHHGPLCCIGFNAKHDIIRSLNETLMNNTRALSLWNGSYEELARDLYLRIVVRPLERELGQLSPGLAGFWNATNATWNRA